MAVKFQCNDLISGGGGSAARYICGDPLLKLPQHSSRLLESTWSWGHACCLLLLQANVRSKPTPRGEDTGADEHWAIRRLPPVIAAAAKQSFWLLPPLSRCRYPLALPCKLLQACTAVLLANNGIPSFTGLCGAHLPASRGPG